MGVQGPRDRPARLADLHGCDDRTLLREIVDDDEDAFTVLVERYQDRVLGHLRRMLGPHDAEDVAQQTFLRVWRSCARYDRRYAPLGWILVVASRLALNHLRDRSRDPLPSMACCSAFAVDAPTPAAAVEDAEERALLERRLESALDRLDPKARLLYELRYRQELDLADIAAHFACNRNAVKQRLHRLRRTLIAALGGDRG